jgi:hypothetical protein|tara:strand:+ start:3552 stop:3797 length:246 start_codon:yes stop_codon:yes gene_type:complete
MIDWTSKVGGWVKGITAISVSLVALGVVWQVLFGDAVSFIGANVVDNITGIVADLGSAGLVGLVTIGIIVWLFRHVQSSDD